MFTPVAYTPPPPAWPPKTKSGMGAYEVQNFVTPQRLINVLKSAQIQIPAGWGGMGHADCGCGCGGTCGGKTAGMGLFESGTDFSGWGIGEWSVVAVGIFAVWSTMGTVARGARSARKAIRRRKAR